MHQGNAETCPVSELKSIIREAYLLDVEESLHTYRRLPVFSGLRLRSSHSSSQ